MKQTKKLIMMLMICIGCSALFGSTAMAQEVGVVEAVEAVAEAVAEVTEAADEINAADTAWMLIATALVLLMTPGLAFFYGGLVRRKNVLSVLMQCFMCMCVMTVLWVVIGYSLAFGSQPGFWGGFEHMMFNGVGLEANGTIPHVLFAAFQGMFAIITPALIIGAFAERMKFSAFLFFSILWLLFVYCPVCHWVWGQPGDYEGFFALGNDGALDFAGGTVVHINAAVAALMAAFVLGKRAGYPSKISPPHNLPFAVLGAGLLWFGWFGFNAGSELAADAVAANALLVTHVAASAAGVTWALIEWIKRGKPTVLGIITGAVAGLVGITPACGFVNSSGALAIGAGAGILAFVFVALKEKLGYDDSLDVWGVHGIAGIWGALATGIFAIEAIGGTAGVLEGNGGQLLIQCKAVLYTLIYSGIVSFVLLKAVDLVVGLRIAEQAERVGLDLSDHAEAAYTLVD